MPLPNVYTQAYGQIDEFLKKIRDGQAPPKFTQQHLKDIGFSSANHKAFIPILKAISFLSEDGSPTTRYHAYRDHSQSRQILGEALKEAYQELFLIKSHPTENDKALIEGKFKSAHNAKDRPAELMAKTFFALLKNADIEHKPKQKKDELTEEDKDKPKQPPVTEIQPPLTPPGLHYNIQIHLPATKDIEVFNAIFKSLKEHLIG